MEQVGDVTRLYWMLRTQTAYPEIVRIESSPRVPLVNASQTASGDWTLSHPPEWDIRGEESWPTN